MVIDSWISHSVGCYFCGTIFDEREGNHADQYNGGDGGSICPKCLEEKDKEPCKLCGWTLSIHNEDGSCPNATVKDLRAIMPESCDTCVYKKTCEWTGDLVHWCKSYAEA